MTWKPGQSGNPSGGQKRVKPFAEALRIELAAVGEDQKALRKIAANLIKLAHDGGELAAIKEIADRLDGKVPQAVHTGQDDEAGPMQVDGMTDPVEMVRTIAFALAKGRDLLNK